MHFLPKDKTEQNIETYSTDWEKENKTVLKSQMLHSIVVYSMFILQSHLSYHLAKLFKNSQILDFLLKNILEALILLLNI